ncbi:MAG: GTPase Era [Firmicutes bacterium]|nr:GTPase Era [Bacillota bacterium]
MIILDIGQIPNIDITKEELIKIANAAFSVLSLKGEMTVELDFISDEEIKELNKRHRGKDDVTDVLSFPLLENDLTNYQFNKEILGNIVIAHSFAKKRAVEFEHSEKRELSYLFVHGLLHLLGFDHNTDNNKKTMRELEEKILSNMDKENMTKKSGFIAVLGKPNVGKSSLINAIIGQKILIISPKPQTTRDRIMGILTEDNSQMIFIDTPGIHTPKTTLGAHMNKAIKSACTAADAIVVVIDSTKPIDQTQIDFIKKQTKIAPTYIVINKSDLTGFEKIYPIINKLSSLLQSGVLEIIPTSAKTKNNIDTLKTHLLTHLKEGEFYFDQDDLSDKPLSFMVSEIIREKALWLLQDEIPHGIAVMIQKYDVQKNLVSIEADIVCEKQTHKQIIIGDNAQKIKEIGTKARIDIEKLLNKKVFLNLFVKVRENWRNKSNIIKDVGYD